MKLIAYILSVYILFLAFTTCNESKVNYSVNPIEDSASHYHTSGFSDLCSPFCSCSCCGANITLKIEKPEIQKVEILSEITDQIVFAGYSYHSIYYGNIWQPPEIG